MNNFITQFEAFLISQKRVAHNTFLAYRKDINDFFGLLQEYEIQQPELIEQKHITEYLSRLHELCLSTRTIARKLSALRLFLLFLRDQKSIELAHVDIISPQQSQPLPIYCTQDEMNELFLIIDKDKSFVGKRNALVIKLLYSAGLRVSELTTLQLSDIRYDEAIITVHGKGGKMRGVPLPEAILELLKKYCRDVRPRLLQQIDKNTKNNEYVFPAGHRSSSKPLSRQAVWKIVKDTVKHMRSLKNVSPHTLRHSLATHNLENGWDLRSLQQLLGHESIATVQIYTHVAVDQLKIIYKKKHPRQ